MARKAASKSPNSAGEPLLTKENFERELKELASMAKQQTWLKWSREQAWILIRSATLLSFAAVYSNVSQLTLSPVYGSIPVSIWHSKGVTAACFLGWSSNLFIGRHLPFKAAQLLPLIAAYIPMIQFFLFKVSGQVGANYEPLIVESLTFLPLLLFSVACTASILEDLEISGGRWRWLSDAAPGISSYAFYKSIEFVSSKILQRTIGASFFQTRLGLQILLAGLYSMYAPSRLIIFAIPAILHAAVFNIHVQYPYTTASLNTTMIKSGWSLIDRHESVTGYLSVIESSKDGFRVMRCDHSLLGGEWLASSQNTLAEPIYGVFVMLEAVRLVKVPAPVPDAEANALVIGLGIGTTPTALMAHGITTTIVEIDPVVHEFATKYFALPPGHNAVIADAVSYAAELARSEQNFDYIVHDVFTGGAEPLDLFTIEFLNDLKAVLKPEGVIAINYAGDLLLPSAHIIIQTIKQVFPNCRIFRESARPSAEKLAAEKRDFTNIVIFCTNSATKIIFREPTGGDFLGSRARSMFLLPQHEVKGNVSDDVDEHRGVLARNDTKRFTRWQQQSALGHWAVMRTVLPKQIWEDW